MSRHRTFVRGVASAPGRALALRGRNNGRAQSGRSPTLRVDQSLEARGCSISGGSSRKKGDPWPFGRWRGRHRREVRSRRPIEVGGDFGREARIPRTSRGMRRTLRSLTARRLCQVPAVSRATRLGPLSLGRFPRPPWGKGHPSPHVPTTSSQVASPLGQRFFGVTEGAVPRAGGRGRRPSTGPGRSAVSIHVEAEERFHPGSLDARTPPRSGRSP